MPKGRLRTEPADVRLIVHDPIQPPAIAAPTVQDAKALADRVHAIVAGPVEKLQNGRIAELQTAEDRASVTDPDRLHARSPVLQSALQSCNL